MSVGRRGYPAEMRQEAARLRADGVGRAAIARQLGIGFSTVARWFREDGVPAPVGVHGRELWRITNRRTIEERWAHEQAEQDAHRDAVGSLTERELFLLGVAIYWAEGSKSKPWRRSHCLQLINSDEGVVRLFLAWLAMLGVERERLRFRLHIHETADAAAAERYWRSVVGEDMTWRPFSLKKHRPLTNRRNTSDQYNGCLVVDVVQSAKDYRVMAGTWEGIVRAAVAFRRHEQSPVV